MKNIGILALLASVSLLQACSSTPETQKQVGCVGAGVVGAAAGYVVGSQFGGGHGKEIIATGSSIGGGLAASRAAGC